MSWYNPLSWFDDPGNDAEKQRKERLYGQADAAGRFADAAQTNFNASTALGNGALSRLGDIANGQNSISAEQLRQGLQQSLAGQQSMAASASPRNAAMAARTAAIQSARLGAGMAGQQALAGLQERQQAQQQYAALLGQMRGQDAQVALGARGNALSGYGAGNAGPQEKGWIEKYGPAVTGALTAGAALSDERHKTDVRDGDGEANRAIDALKAYVFKYRDEKNGRGDQVGVMAQELEGAGLGHAVMDTPGGKMVHGAKLATANTAMLAALGARVAKLERGKGR